MGVFTLCLVVGVLACHVGPSLAQPQIALLEDNNLHLMDLANGNKVTLGTNIFSSGRAIDYDFVEQKIYVTDISNDVLYEIDISDPLNPIQTVLWNTGYSPWGLALDYINKKLYWSDTETDEIRVLDLVSMETATIVSGLDQTWGIALDLRDDQRWLYFSDWGEPEHISRVRPDGSERQTLITNSNISSMEWNNGITIDHDTNKIFWVEGYYGYLASANLDGSNPQILTNVAEVGYPFDVDVYGDHVYWSDWEYESYRRVNKNTLTPIEVLCVSDNYVAGVKVMAASRQPPGTPVCDVNNGGCSHVCVVRRPCAPRSCVCPAGMVIVTPGGTQCVPAPSTSGVCGPGYEGYHPDCTQCSPGTIQPETGNGNTCYPCCPGETSVSPFTECIPGCDAGYEGSAPDCVQCTAGFYQPLVGNNNTCMSCGEGQTSLSPFTSCVCDAGYEGSPPDCEQCTTGSYQPLVGNDNDCMDCEEGETSLSPFTICVCDAGYEGSPPNCVQCTTGSYQPLVGNDNNCTLCEEGETSYSPFTTCVSEQLCPPGTWDVSQGERQHHAKGKLHATCVECDQGTWRSAAGGSHDYNCTDCPEGTTTIGTGSTCIEDCDMCAEGYMGLVPNCVPCPENSTACQIVVGNSGKGHALAKGKQNKRLGSSANAPNRNSNQLWRECNAGEYMEFGTCTLCPPNTYQDVPHGGESCSPCPSGKITAGYGSTSIKDCVEVEVAEEKNYDMVIGAVIGSVVIMVLVAAILIICRFRNKRMELDIKAMGLPQNPLASVQGDAEHTGSFSRATRVGSWNKSFQLPSGGQYQEK